MRLHAFFLIHILCHMLTISAEEVEVVEAIPSTELNENGSSVQDRDNNETKPDKLSMETDNEQDGTATNHIVYNPPQRQSNTNGGNRPSHLPHPLSHNVQKPYHSKQPIYDHNSYDGPPPPLPPKYQAMEKYGTANDIWPAPVSDKPKIISLDVKCEKNLMKVYIGFDQPFYGIVFSKGHYSNIHCVHLPAGLGRTSAHFEIGIHACGTSGNSENGLYGYGTESGSGTYFENIIVIQYDPQVQEVWDQARKLRCTWHDQYEKSVTFRPFPVDMLDVVRTDFAGDNVGCWMQIQVGKGPWASEVSGLVKIGQTMTMVLAIKDDDSKFDMLVRNCMAHDGKRAPIQLVDQKGCVTRPKLMSRFTKIKNFGASASVLSYAHFQAFKFPDSMEVHFQCTIQICRYQCPDQCSDGIGIHGQHVHNNILDFPSSGPEASYGPIPPVALSLESYLHPGRPRGDQRIKRAVSENSDPEREVGVNKVIRVVSTGDLTFSLEENNNTGGIASTSSSSIPTKEEIVSTGLICMTTPGFAVTLIVLLSVLLISCVMSATLFFKLRPFVPLNKVNSFSNTPVKTKPVSYMN
ncbi:uncharacterized protein LOC112906669, partial [Agrilus planipennis]|uniref:Uncharacterized protein LOC112906669 n=1 Tax=Agrilus planipennis TaxID=224129 RepID=A0A7F5RLZ4_AGRPL